MNDPVNNPKHYTDGCSVECIDMMQTALGWDGVIYFCLGNAYKYLWRHKLKNNPEEDLHKAKWYIDRAITMAQDDPDSYGYLLSIAEPLMQLVETYTILYQSKKAMDDHKIDMVNFEANFDNNTERRDLLSDLIDTKRILNSSYGSKLFDTEETKSDHDCKDELILTAVEALKRALNSVYGTELFNTEETKSDQDCSAPERKTKDDPYEESIFYKKTDDYFYDMLKKFKTNDYQDCMDEDDWAFVSADAKIIHNRLNSKEARDGHVTGVDRSVVIGALDRILERCKKHRKEDDK